MLYARQIASCQAVFGEAEGGFPARPCDVTCVMARAPERLVRQIYLQCRFAWLLGCGHDTSVGTSAAGNRHTVQESDEPSCRAALATNAATMSVPWVVLASKIRRSSGTSLHELTIGDRMP